VTKIVSDWCVDVSITTGGASVLFGLGISVEIKTEFGKQEAQKNAVTRNESVGFIFTFTLTESA
jgi:hypothetical protein